MQNPKAYLCVSCYVTCYGSNSTDCWQQICNNQISSNEQIAKLNLYLPVRLTFTHIN